MQEVRRAVSGAAIKGCIEVWRKGGERLACDLHRLWGDRVLRVRNPDDKDHGFKLKATKSSASSHRQILNRPTGREAAPVSFAKTPLGPTEDSIGALPVVVLRALPEQSPQSCGFTSGRNDATQAGLAEGDTTRDVDWASFEPSLLVDRRRSVLRGVALVPVAQAVHLRDRHHVSSGGSCDGPRYGRIFFEREMCSGSCVVRYRGVQDAA